MEETDLARNKKGGMDARTADISDEQTDSNGLSRENFSLAPASEAQNYHLVNKPECDQNEKHNHKYKRMLALAWSGHFPPPGTLHVKPNFNKNKLRKEQGNWGVSWKRSPAPLLPKAGMNILGKELRTLRISFPLGQQGRHPTMTCFFCPLLQHFQKHAPWFPQNPYGIPEKGFMDR